MPFINLNPATIESDNLNIEKKNNNKKTKKTTRITDFMKDSNKQKRVIALSYIVTKFKLYKAPLKFIRKFLSY